MKTNGGEFATVLVLQAWRLRTAADAIRMLNTAVEVQGHGEGWMPTPRERPWVLFEFDGDQHLLQWKYGLENSEIQLLRLKAEPVEAFGAPIVISASNGC